MAKTSFHNSFPSQCPQNCLSWDTIKRFFSNQQKLCTIFLAISYFSKNCHKIKITLIISLPGMNHICISSIFITFPCHFSNILLITFMPCSTNLTFYNFHMILNLFLDELVSSCSFSNFQAHFFPFK